MIALHAFYAYKFSSDSERKEFNGSHDAGVEDTHMNTYSTAVNRSQLQLMMFFVVGLIVISGNSLADEGDKRLSMTTQNTMQQRNNGTAGVVSQDEFDALVSDGTRPAEKRSSVQSKTTPRTSQAANTEFWFYSADVVLFNDHDGDGYFYGIDLLFDADTFFTFADVYAVVYLSFEGGSWNEYAATENFTLFGSSADDDYVVVTELLAGYPTGSYDVLIELFDAYDDSFVAWIGPDETSELAFLPLEDADRDTVVPEIIVVDHHGGGSFSWLLVLSLGLATLARFRHERYA
jgi:hypothetical protein